MYNLPNLILAKCFMSIKYLMELVSQCSETQDTGTRVIRSVTVTQEETKMSSEKSSKILSQP